MSCGAVMRGWSPRKQALHTAQHRENNRVVMLAVEIKGLFQPAPVGRAYVDSVCTL
jgi:hypothetical protein